ncbi:MAG: endonuclease III [Candidatus Kryptoniota bacterium]
MEDIKIKKRRAKKIYSRLKEAYPDARIALNFKSPFELLIATILSAQCTDARVNMVTPELFKKYRTPEDFARADVKTLEETIKSTGFFRQKAKAIINASRTIVQKFGGHVPQTMDELLQLGGVGRKTANVVLGNAFGVPGIAVDTHVKRLSQRLGLSYSDDPDKIEADLMKLFPEETWVMLCHLLMTHGRRVCTARSPHCSHCVIKDYCPSANKFTKQKPGGRARKSDV